MTGLRKNRGYVSYLALLGLLAAAGGLAGCAALVVTGAVAGTVAGIEYTYDNVAYKTFSFPYDPTYRATMRALERMGIGVAGTKKTNKGTEIVANTVDLRIEIELEKVTEKSTKVSVNAKKGVFSKDKATASEILVQVGKGLEG